MTVSAGWSSCCVLVQFDELCVVYSMFLWSQVMFLPLMTFHVVLAFTMAVLIVVHVQLPTPPPPPPNLFWDPELCAVFIAVTWCPLSLSALVLGTALYYCTHLFKEKVYQKITLLIGWSLVPLLWRYPWAFLWLSCYNVSYYWATIGTTSLPNSG